MSHSVPEIRKPQQGRSFAGSCKVSNRAFSNSEGSSVISESLRTSLERSERASSMAAACSGSLIRCNSSRSNPSSAIARAFRVVGTPAHQR